MNLFSLILSIGISTSVCLADGWIPQLGTTEFPKLPEISHDVRKGDVFLAPDGSYCKARIDGQIEPEGHVPSPCQNEMYWRQIPLGSLLLPKNLNTHTVSNVGELFISPETNTYYKAVCIPDKHQSDYDCLEWYNIAMEWMGLMKSDISDTRLGDLAIPGTHDSGTSGITEDSYLIDKNFLFTLGEIVVPEVLSNWSLTQDTDLLEQLEKGFRKYDLRVADCEVYNDTFRWWHGLAGDVIDEGLEQILNFASSYPDEILILEFVHFASPGIPGESGTLPISSERNVVLSDLILDYLSPVLVPYVNISDNPTVNEVLATGSNVIAVMGDDEIRARSDLYWPHVLHAAWSGVTNPEDLYNERSLKLNDFLLNHKDRITDLSGCATPDEKTISGAMLRVYGGEHPLIGDILGRIAPGLEYLDLDADAMSFEGVFIDLLNMARYGVNTLGMSVRDDTLYSTGTSVHYRGTNYMFRHWLARPGKFKRSIVSVDDASVSSDMVTTAIMANLGEIPREAAITFQGNSRTGFYYWDNFTAYGGEDGLLCKTIDTRFIISSAKYNLRTEIHVENGYEFTMQEGQFPADANIVIEVSSEGSSWYDLANYNIQGLIEVHQDMFVRGDDLGDGHGFGYISDQYDLYGEECAVFPPGGYDQLISW